MMLLASAGGKRVPVTAHLVQADEDTIRDVMHTFNEIGLVCLDPQWAGGRPCRLSPDDEDFVIQTATTSPAKLGQPFTRWSLRKLIAYPRCASWPSRAGRRGCSRARLFERRGACSCKAEEGVDTERRRPTTTRPGVALLEERAPAPATPN